jgi:hypothetical protein
VNISGGSVGADFTASGVSVINISGGSIGASFGAESSSKINLFGTKFLLGSSDITSTLVLNTPTTITQRNILLSGFLADGSPFDFDLRSTTSLTQDYFSPSAVLTVTLVIPEPNSILLLLVGLMCCCAVRRNDNYR